jgi:Transcriptional regulators, similar to M. xanthus CarD
VVQRIIDGEPLMFYQLIVLDDGGGDLFVPVDKVAAVGIRLLLEKSEIPKLLDHLMKPCKIADGWKQRTLNNLKLFASGSAFDLAEIVESLTGLNETKALSFGEQKTLERARRLLICEIAEVMGESRETVTEQLEDALKARPRAVQTSATTRRTLSPACKQLAGDGLPADAIEKRREPLQEKVEKAFSLAV